MHTLAATYFSLSLVLVLYQTQRRLLVEFALLRCRQILFLKAVLFPNWYTAFEGQGLVKLLYQRKPLDFCFNLIIETALTNLFLHLQAWISFDKVFANLRHRPWIIATDRFLQQSLSCVGTLL